MSKRTVLQNLAPLADELNNGDKLNITTEKKPSNYNQVIGTIKIF